MIENVETYMQASPLVACAFVYAAGVLASFTPCTYPVIPITVGYIGVHATGSRLRGLLLALVYVLGTSVTYTALGLIAALTGGLFGRIQSSPLIHLFVANVCILMGLAMLEVFHLPLPGLTRTSGAEQARGGLIGAFLLGLAAGLVLGPCTAPVLGVVLGLVAAGGQVLWGVILLFVFAFGLGTLFILLGTFTGLVTALPRAGAWMITVQKAFGWLFLIMGEYFLIVAGRLSI